MFEIIEKHKKIGRVKKTNTKNQYPEGETSKFWVAVDKSTYIPRAFDASDHP